VLNLFRHFSLLIIFLYFNSDPLLAEKDFDFFYSKNLKDINTSKYDDYYVPASLTKLVTASHALFSFGENHTFLTEVYMTDQNEIAFLGFGDPDFTSSKLKICLDSFVKNKVKNISRIILDTSKYDNSIEINGRGKSLNPYDARISALPINYNSISLKISKNSIESGEPETPLTNYAKTSGQILSNGLQRIGLNGIGASERQFAELTEIFLTEMGFVIKNSYLIKKIPENAKLLGKCSSAPLNEILYSMLKYSNNFSANQIFLNTGANFYGYPASIEKSKKAVNKFLLEEVGIEGDFQIEEGAGLSRDSKLTPKQLMKILLYFRGYKQLLPESNGVFYKSGTLNGIYNLAGYYSTDGNVQGYFSLFSRRQMSIPERVDLVMKKVSNLD
jgi:D-alanyl-D-alanine carboxypeptidase/D-alanyl-D-alanine-endopeptidase (penicillin-binding protein 4)